MIQIYHNPRCSKSREGLEILENSGKKFEIIKYLENPLSESEIGKLCKLLGISAFDLVRKNETIWKENYKDKEFKEAEILTLLAENPNLIERPIVVNGKKAIIGRPPELIKEIV